MEIKKIASASLTDSLSMDARLVLKVKEHRHFASLFSCMFVFSLSDIGALKILDFCSRYGISSFVV